MATEEPVQPTLQLVERPLNLIPVVLKEAALDSPTFRATALHFAEQIELVERWLEGYVKAATKLVAEASALEAVVNAFLAQSIPSAQLSEAVLDHDYTVLAMRRFNEGARDFWQNALRGVKRYDSSVIDPIKVFLSTDLKNFKETKRAMQDAQKTFDSTISRYLGQNKSKEASSLREDAFQLHEARKAYLRASMDYSVQSPQLRASLDKLVVKIFAEQWKEMRSSREANATMFSKWTGEVERVKGWSKEMENSERAFKRELAAARRQIEESAESMTRPSRELEDYSATTVPFLGSGPSTASAKQEKAERQGWLYLKTTTGKPARTVWSRRWFFVKNGIYGWLIQGSRSGGVEESEKTGVLLCSVRPAFQEERRFCFEVKTKDTSTILQAETQQELTEWIDSFEMAKRKALQNPTSTEQLQTSGVDPAFAISPPIAPEFAAKIGESHAAQGSEDANAGGLTLPEAGIAARASFDVNASRRTVSGEKDGEGTREHAARLIQKLDLSKRSATGTQGKDNVGAGGIASLISASHNILPVGPSAASASEGLKRSFTMPASSLTPSTLANPPAPTNLSHTAVVVSSERGVVLGRADESAVPSGILANLWGSNNWGYVNRIGDKSEENKSSSQNSAVQPRSVSVTQDDAAVPDGSVATPVKSRVTLAVAADSPGSHRKALSLGTDLAAATNQRTAENGQDGYPASYPMALKAQNAQFRVLFPTVPRSEKVVLVFRATWNPNDQQEFNSRLYVTEKGIYSYSNHLGFVLIMRTSLSTISDVTAAPGRDCDFVYLHLKDNQQNESKRITVKVFLEQLRLLQRRLNYLVRNANSDDPATLDEIIKTLVKMEIEQPKRSSSVESWEEVTYDADGPDGPDPNSPQRRGKNVKTSLRIDGNLFGDIARTGREIQRFKLPSQPVIYAPQGMQASISRDFNISAKALFHIMFGDKSTVFQLLYANRWSQHVAQTPWTKQEAGGLWTRRFSSLDETPIADTQTIDIMNDHLCYVVTNDKHPWRLPYAARYSLTTKYVVTHSAKSRCKLAVFQSLKWRSAPRLGYVRRLIESTSLNSLEADALDLTTVAHDQVAKLGNHSKTNKAIDIFGGIGQSSTKVAVVASVSTLSQADQTASSAQTQPVPSNPPVPSRILPRPTSLRKLITDDLLARLISALSLIFDILIALGRGTVGLCTAHTLLVTVLIVSVLYNTWNGYRDGLTWYRDRSAGSFMARVGVVPDARIARAVYLKDVEGFLDLDSGVATANGTVAGFELGDAGSLVAGSPKSCRGTFGELLVSSRSRAMDGVAAAKLHRSRDALARNRHDLIVALRVVNRVEQEVVRSEWEEWVRTEEVKCRRVEEMARARKGSGKGGKSDEDDLGVHFVEYCDSCRKEAASLGKDSRLM